jgi:hypothetical protein
MTVFRRGGATVRPIQRWGARCHTSSTMDDGWYFDDHLVQLRMDMLRTHMAWKAAVRCPLGDERRSRQQLELMDEARRAVDAYVEHRTLLRARGRLLSTA